MKNIILMKTNDIDELIDVYTFDDTKVSFDELSNKINDLRYKWFEDEIDEYLTTYIEENIPKDWGFEAVIYNEIFI